MSESLSANFGASLTSSSWLPSYANYTPSELIGIAQQQASFSPVAPAGNQAAALQDINAASEATDPNLVAQLLQDALQQLTPAGGGLYGGTGAGAGGATGTPPYVPSGGASGNSSELQQLEQEVQQLQQQIAQLESGGDGNGGGGAAPVSSAPTAASGDTGDTGGDSPGIAGSSNLSVNGNSVNTGMYTITGGSGDDGSLTITNNQTGQTTEVWGDPHIKVNGQDTADFQNSNLNIQLQDGTVIHIQPTAVQNGVAHIDQVSITNGNGQSVTMGGVNGSFANGVNTSNVQTGDTGVQSGLYNAPNATNITLGADGMLHYDNANGSMGATITETNGHETDLDGAGGGLLGAPATSGGASGGGSSGLEQLITELNGAIEQYASGMNQTMMQITMNNIMSSMEANFPQAQAA